MNATYERMLNEAMKAPDGGAKVRIALHITLAANRPLSVLEMNTAMAAYGGVTSFADIEEETAEYYRNLCGFVLTVTNDTIFFFHQTVKDFLLSPLGELDVVTKSFGLPLEDFTSVALWKTIHHGRHCHEEVVETLLRNKANVDIRHGPQLRTPLHEVANRPPGEVSKKVMKILLLHRAEVKAKDRNGNTALHLLVSRVQPYEKAEISCFIEMVEILLEYGADVDAIDNSGQTVLHLAAEQVGNSQIIRVLLRYNADVNAMYKRCGMQEDALGMALRTLARVTWSRDDYEAQREVVDVLLRWKWTAAGVPKEISDAILKAELEANEYRSSEALKENRFDDAMVLQSVIGGPTKEPQGKPALHIALIYYRKYFERGQIGFLATMRELISKKAHRERWANLEATDQFGRTALHIACEAGPFRELRLDEYAIVKLLLQMMVFSKANVNAVDNDGHTALDLAQKRGYGEIVQLLSPYATASSVSDHESRHS
ncbi:hypothetical protein H2203_004467 [Taxawa tesnikishii (nom. ined.)]|nr:hypothetical protein H2203_004467 [Dothideales sp. JES 119]